MTRDGAVMGSVVNKRCVVLIAVKESATVALAELVKRWWTRAAIVERWRDRCSAVKEMVRERARMKEKHGRAASTAVASVIEPSIAGCITAAGNAIHRTTARPNVLLLQIL